MTTAYRIHPAFYGCHPISFLISDLNRSLPTSHGDYRGAFYPSYVNYLHAKTCFSSISSFPHHFRTDFSDHLPWFLNDHWVPTNISWLHVYYNTFNYNIANLSRLVRKERRQFRPSWAKIMSVIGRKYSHLVDIYVLQLVLIIKTHCIRILL